MTRVLIAIDDDNLVSDLRSILDELDGMDVKGVARSVAETHDLAGRLEPDLIFVHEDLGAEPVSQIIRDLSARRPSMGILQVSPIRTANLVISAMEAGARGVVAYPFAYEDVASRTSSAAEWSVHMKGVLQGAQASTSGRGRVIALVGAKGGVGTTTLATHLAVDHVTQRPEHRVCVVDVDVEKGDVGAILEVRQSVSIADVAKVSGDLSMTTIKDAVIEHESGIHVLLAPLDVRESEYVSAEALRSIIALLRRDFDVVIVDGGGHVSPPQAAIVEIAEEVLVVTTADVLAIRGMRRRMIAWDALGVKDEGAVKVVVNKVDRASVFPASSVERLTTAHVLDTHIPLSPRVLEPSINERNPQAVTEVAWWRLMTDLRRELGLEPAADDRALGKRGGRGQRDGRRKHAQPEESEEPEELTQSNERGAIALENLGVLPAAILICLLAWQIAVAGFTAIYSGHATTAAARELSVTGSPDQAQWAAERALPGPLQDGVVVSSNPGQVTVKLRIPNALPEGFSLPTHITTTREVVMEP